MTTCGNIDASNESMARLVALEKRTGYSMQQFNGQRMYWNPNSDEESPPRGCEVFVGKIPRNLYEDELVPLFEQIGKIYKLRLMMDFSGFNRGYAFVCFTCPADAARAIQQLDNYEIRPAQRIGVCKSVDNCRLFVNGFPRDKTRDEIFNEMSRVSEEVSDVLVHPGSSPGEFNRGFAFVEYRTHRAAAMARRKLMPGRITIFGSEVSTDWAEAELDLKNAATRVKNVYVRNLKVTTTERTIFDEFNAIRPGKIERVKKIQDKDYAFVHFVTKEDAMGAIQVMNGQKIDGQEIEVSLAKPPANKNESSNPTSLVHSLSVRQPAATVTSRQLSSMANNSAVQERIPSYLFRNATPNPAFNQFTFVPHADLQNTANRQVAMAQLNGLATLPTQQSIPTGFPSNQFPGRKPTQLHVATAASINSPNSNLLPNNGFSSLPATMENLVETAPVSYLNVRRDGTPSSLYANNDLSNNGLSEQEDHLEPVSNLQHFSAIDCPISYLDEIIGLLTGGTRPKYELFSEKRNGKNFYVSKVTFLGKSYRPPRELFCDNIAQSKLIAANYAVEQSDAWVKEKLFEKCLMNTSSPVDTTAPPPTIQTPDGSTLVDSRIKELNPMWNLQNSFMNLRTSKLPATNGNDQMSVAPNSAAGDAHSYFSRSPESLFASNSNGFLPAVTSPSYSLWSDVSSDNTPSLFSSANGDGNGVSNAHRASSSQFNHKDSNMKGLESFSFQSGSSSMLFDQQLRSTTNQ